MRTSKFSESQIVAILREAEAGMPVAEVIRKHGVSRWSSPREMVQLGTRFDGARGSP